MAKQTRKYNISKAIDDLSWEKVVGMNHFQRQHYRRAADLVEINLDFSVPLPQQRHKLAAITRDEVLAWAKKCHIKRGDRYSLATKAWDEALATDELATKTEEEIAYARVIVETASRFECLVPDDKNTKKAWGCSKATAIELLAEVMLSREPRWFPSAFGAKEVGAFVHGTFAAVLPGFLKRGSRQKEQEPPQTKI